MLVHHITLKMNSRDPFWTAVPWYGWQRNLKAKKRKRESHVQRYPYSPSHSKQVAHIPVCARVRACTHTHWLHMSNLLIINMNAYVITSYDFTKHTLLLFHFLIFLSLFFSPYFIWYGVHIIFFGNVCSHINGQLSYHLFHYTSYGAGGVSMKCRRSSNWQEGRRERGRNSVRPSEKEPGTEWECRRKTDGRRWPFAARHLFFFCCVHRHDHFASHSDTVCYFIV